MALVQIQGLKDERFPREDRILESILSHMENKLINISYKIFHLLNFSQLFSLGLTFVILRPRNKTALQI